ncbi:TetR/AcrR family transcriptional regulator [Amycolatopsis sp. CA-128772]|uniref:TetR/AcrR family transcriptional regulator n=1 Tax=Amycolatopsis sp. CA-128772 TaxID=2073159 RepID=UPI000CD0B6A8|nr:TetR family transcriptional regulator C-terminal domain-containing protein [Amycolatopsis sp. CA-128772]
MGRPSKAVERKAELLAVARRTVVERGLLNLRIRDVADGAGVTPGSVLYYFPSLAELLQEVQRDAVERFCTARERAAAGGTAPGRRLVAMIRSGLPAGPGDELCVLLYELGTIARRDPAYAARHIALFERQVGSYAAILEAGAATGEFTLTDDATTIARNLVALEDGYGLHITHAVPTLTRTAAEELMLAFARTATGSALAEQS